MKIDKSYKVLRTLPSFEDRFAYLKLEGTIGISLFDENRLLNQRFYTSSLWREIRNEVVVRDGGNDLGCFDFPIFGMVLVHHMNPLSINDFLEFDELMLDPEYLISVSLDTHNAIHFGIDTIPNRLSTVRRPNDTKLW